ncbi:DUF2924 domain-containing protein [Sansalvadorimonas verongulae]|uniref:DUF2924 domain-containing protein n=1 Tax=Sansalvadorimonas verongulae TaxID=2172824 RepID=UPI0012BD0827|nr:DUF2924 domain-containing protein [Sansalvadorimonas verongulae]MTI12706.1 DUF2924 domain-containing protein [Sansalvadorimonas verongulae]
MKKSEVDKSKSEQTLAAQVASIMRMEREELLQTWQDLLGKEAPTLHIALLRQQLAWKVQEQALGGLSETAKKQLNRAKMSVIKRKKVSTPRSFELPHGTRLTRLFKDEIHEVIVTPEGYEYRGEIYKSLTKIAKAITGSQWSGPAFFGLRKRKKKWKEQ